MKRDIATVVIAAKAGRLGNRLFLSAYFIANALAYGYRLFNPALGEYAELFEGSASDPLCRFPQQGDSLDVEIASQIREVAFNLSSLVSVLGIPKIGLLDIRRTHDAEEEAFDLNGEAFEQALQSNRYLFVKGWKFRDDQNLLRFHSEITEYFTPVFSVRHPAEQKIAAARAQGDLIIGVHIRQGDYREWKNGVHYFETSQYAHWMRELVGLFPDKKVVFVVCASDLIDRSEFHGLEFLDGLGTVATDLHTLALCDLIMGPPSTFSTWASYWGRVPLCMLQHHRQEVAAADFVLHDRV